ncbi:carbohydrate binding domain-containing protein [Clostridium folliculivorans]|uniref:Glucan endo-1,3-beta-D-glucosidase n=1 Tax=Clostridium folliculivorans TaxID=2886038 RepID=A0A9W6D8M2_9CLOT|nr:carbohydrate binding domain-containing protein [Clostridium folliculivorans]GKU23474.1 hypothetical protein CFOLD11_03000 [Clostridium folliculivorans]GKU29590.1 hypothetical protein CFB3_16970 [Clostridium folliculivorans]
MAELSKINKKKSSRQNFKRFISMFIAMLFILGDMGINPALVATVKACTDDSSSTTVKSVVKPDDFYVQKGTKLNEIIELLPAKLNVVMSNYTKGAAEVIWDTTHYVSLTKPSESYTFSGIIKGTKLTTKITVNVANSYIKSIKELSQIEVDNGTKLEEIGLPKYVSAITSDKTVVYAKVTWDTSNYNGNVDKETNIELKGTVSGYDKQITLKVKVGSPFVVSAVEPSTLTVKNGTSLSELNNTLPKTVQVKLSNGTNNSVKVSWNTCGYNGNVSKETLYNFKGDLEGQTKVTANITVKVGSPFAASIEEPKMVTVNNGTALDVVKKLLPKTVEVKWSNGYRNDAKVAWDTASYDGNTAVEKIFTFTGTVEGTTKTTVINIKVGNPTVVSVKNPSSITVGNGILDEDLLSLLPKTVEVKMSNGTIGTAKVTWNIEKYNPKKTKAETYTFKGKLEQCKETAEIIVYVRSKNEAPTIVSIINPASVNVANGTPAADLQLPKTVNVNLSNRTVGTANVSWDTSTYNGNVSGVQAFILQGTVEGTTTKASITVNVGAPYVISVAAPAAIYIDNGTALQNLPLPETVEVTLSNGIKVSVKATWDSSNYDGNVSKATQYVFNGTLEGTDKTTSIEINVAAPKAPEDPWSLVWSDEFDGTGSNLDTNGVDLSKWAYQNGTGAEYGLDGWGNNEQEYYTKDNIKVQDGNLVIQAKNDGRNGKPYTSGRLWTNPTFDKTYGKFEARIKMPKGEGLWPAFWMMPKDSEYGTWASSGEIDIMEARGRLLDQVEGTLHYGKTWPNNKSTGNHYTFQSGQDITGYHTYSIEWEPGEMRWYVDGNLYQTTSNWFSQGENQPDKYAYPAPFDKDFYMILNLAVGGNFDGGRVPAASDIPATMSVDYVRVYDLTGRPYKAPVEPVMEKDNLPDGSKVAVDGNYVYDTNYEKGFTDITSDTQSLDNTYWNFVHQSQFGGAGSVSVDTINNNKYAKVDITNAGSQVHSIQMIQKVALAKGRYYKLSFDAKSSAARTMAVKFGGDASRGWQVYSDNFNVNLKNELQSYAFTFQMQANTDPLARLEFNMGLNTNSVWVGNVKLEEINSLNDQDAPKEPLKDGNHVYNGSFDLGTMDRMEYWHLQNLGSSSVASVDPNTRELQVAISNGGYIADSINLLQKGMNLLPTDKYKVTFDGRAGAARQIKVALVSKDGRTNYSGDQTIDLTNTMGEKSFEFTMPNVTDTEGQLVFKLGLGSETVYLDNVKMVRLTNNNTGELSLSDQFPLKNGDFSNGMTKWTDFVQGRYDGWDKVSSAKVENGQLKYLVSSIGNNPWDVMLMQNDFQLYKGKTYVVSLDIRSTMPRTVEVVVDANGNRYLSKNESISTTTKTLNYELTLDSDMLASFKLLLGKVDGTVNNVSHEVYVDNVRVEEKGAREKAFPLKNGYFTDGTTNWNEFVQGRYDTWDNESKYSVENGGMKFHVYSAANNPWDVMLYQESLALSKGKTYTVSFNARSTTPRLIELTTENSSYTRYLDKMVKLEDYVQTYSYEFTIDKDDVAGLKFLLGKVDGLGEIGIHDVYIDNVRFEVKGAKDATGELAETADNIHLPAAPALSPDADRNELGQDIKLTFGDNSAWRNAITALTIDGNTIDSSKYTVDAGAITIKSDQFTAEKAYVIDVKATGFERAEVTQTIQAKSDWTLSWDDEFDGSGTNVDTNGVNLDKWAYQNGTGAEYGIDGWGNNEKEYYQKDNIKVENGNLVIEAKPEAKNGKTYTSGRLWTSPTFSQQYGKFEARMKLPKGQGFWPAFWMMPKDSAYGTWASSGEVDIMEARGRVPDSIAGTLHYGKPWPNNKSTGATYNFPTGQDITGFHTYSVEWEPGEIRWYVDGNLYQTTNNWFSQSAGQPDKNAYPAPFNKPFYIILNLAVGGNFDGGVEPSASDFPAKMEVDYVRAYDLTGRQYKQPVEPILTKDTLPADAKQPIDGNYVHDVSFNQPITEVTTGSLNPENWNFVHVPDAGGAGDVSIDTINSERFAKVNITNVGTQNYALQLIQNVALAKGRYYKLTFDGKAAANRNISVKFGGGADRGWSAYSDNFDVALKDSVQSYEYRFQMQADTDTLARMEFNMGTNNAAVWIGNVKVEEVDGLYDPNAAKTPLDDGNHVYNGNFELGTMERMAFWNFNTSGAIAQASVNPDATEFKAAIDNGGTSRNAVNLVQKGMNLLQSDSYELTFDGRAASARDIEVKLLSKDGSTVYATQILNLGTASSKQTIDFTMPQGVTDTEGQLVFNMGGTNVDVYLDNIKLIRTTNNNVDYTGVDLFPLKNGDFSLGLNAWEPFTQGANASFDVVNGEAKVGVQSLGTEAWNVMLNQSNMKLSKGFEYVVSFDARATVNRDIEATLENSSYTRRFDSGFIALTPQTKHFEYSFKMTVDDVLALKFILGKTPQGAVGDVFIDNVVLQVKNAPVKKPPMLGADSTNNNAGQPIDIIFGQDDAWANAITAVKINDALIEKSKYTLSSGKLTLAPELFTSEGSYNISVEASGYANTSVTQKIFPSSGNLVLNGDMSLGDVNWNFWNNAPDWSSYTIADGVADIKINYHGAKDDEWGVPFSWSTQFAQKGIQLSANKTYELSFKAWSTVNRPIIAEMTNYNGSPKVNFNITSDKDAVYKYTLKPTQDTNMNLTYLLGYIEDGTNVTPSGEHHVFIDDVSIKEVKVSVDKTALVSKINEAQSKVQADYTQASWQTLQNALSNAIAVNAKTDATQAEVDSAVASLTTAINGLVKNSPVPPVTGTNIALNKIAAASSNIKPAQNALDGDKGTRWESEFNDNQWISVYLGGVYSLDKVLLNWEGAYGKEYKIQVASVMNPTEADWKDVYTESNGDGAIDEISMNKVEARYVRMLGIKRALPYGYSLWEFEVYGTQVGDLDPVVATKTLYLTTGGKLSLTPGTSEAKDVLLQDQTHVEYTIDNLNGSYNKNGNTSAELYLNGLAVGEGIKGDISYDFDGDGVVDRVESLDMMPTDGAVNSGSYENFKRASSFVSGSEYKDFTNGKVKVSLYILFGTGNGEVKVSAPTNSSNIVLPYGIN